MEIIDCNNAQWIWAEVKKNDTIETICSIFNVGINAIIRNNCNLDFYEGEVVKVLKNMNSFHIVKPMETLESVSKKYGVDIDVLIKTNNLTSKRLFVGQMLSISAKI